MRLEIKKVIRSKKICTGCGEEGDPNTIMTVDIFTKLYYTTSSWRRNALMEDGKFKHDQWIGTLTGCPQCVAKEFDMTKEKMDELIKDNPELQGPERQTVPEDEVNLLDLD